MPERRWKRTERAIAAAVGGQRVPATGRRGPDVEHPTLAIEVKSRQNLPTWLKDAIAQAVAAAGDKLPVVVLHELGSRHGEDIVLIRLADFKRILPLADGVT